MILDALNRYANSQALTATAVSGDVLDHGADREMGIGEPMVVLVNVEVAADDGNADETYEAVLQASSDEAFSSPVEVGRVTIPRGSVAGSRFFIPVPADFKFDQYSRLNFELGGTSPSVTVSAFLQPHNMAEPAYKAYADNITIS